MFRRGVQRYRTTVNRTTVAINDDQKLSPSPGLVNLSPVVKRRHGDLDRHDFLRAISVGHGYVVDAGLPDSRTGLQSVHAVFQLSSDFERNF